MSAGTLAPLPSGRNAVRGSIALAVLGVVVVASLVAADAPTRVVGAAALAVVVVPAVVYLATLMEPSVLLCGGIVLSMFSAGWRHIGLPGVVSPDRFVLLAAFASFLLREPALGERRRVRLGLTHLVMALAVAYVIGSAIAVGTLGHRSAIFPLVDRFGITPFILFAIAPAAFPGARERRLLLGTLVAMGAYLGVTAIAEGLPLRALVWPRYILDPDFGYQAGRARGPFVEATVNGLALFYCAAACGVAAATWRSRAWRRAAVGIGLLCLAGEIFTLQRSVWLGSIAALVVVMLAAPRLRGWAPAAAVGGGIAVVAVLLLVPGLQDRATMRLQDNETVWARKSLNVAAENMFLARPLLGFGWDEFQRRSGDHFQQSPDYPIANATGDVHNVLLGYLAELGLVGTTLWALALLLAVAGSIMRRGPPGALPLAAGPAGHCGDVARHRGVHATGDRVPELCAAAGGGVARACSASRRWVRATSMGVCTQRRWAIRLTHQRRRWK